MEGDQKLPNIPELFRGKCVLITGATGFVGKVLVEKLLRSCPNLLELIILLRPSKKGDVEKRLNDLLEHQVFDRLRNERSDALQQIRAVSGDIALENLGLGDAQLKKVTAEVSFIFNCAANVRFDDEPKNTLTANLLGVKNVLDICKSCRKLEALVHVSTAFSFCNRKDISEDLYPEAVNPEEILDTLKWMTNDQLRFLCNYYVKGRPSLYHFSKALAEIFIVKHAETVPAIIVRPSIVTASVNEPFPGWIDNYNGPSGFIAVCGKGIVKTLLVNPEVNADWVPVDIVSNTLIVAAYYMAIISKSEKLTSKLISQSGVPIINCTCPTENVVTWMKVVDLCLPFLEQYPSSEVYGKPGGTVTSCPIRYFMCRMMSHYIPALFVDFTLCFVGRKPKSICLYRNIHRVMSHLEHFTTHSFIFHSPNMRRLVEIMNPKDKELFPIDQKVLNWTQYMENYVLGVRRYFLKEKDETLPQSRKKMMRIHYFWLTLKISSVLGFILAVRALTLRFQKNPKLSLLPSFPILHAIAFLRRKFPFSIAK